MADDEIEQCLRRITRQFHEQGDATINKIRGQVEDELDLGSGFLKDAPWKARSKDIIQSAIDDDEPDSPVKPAPKSKAKATKATVGTKRKSDDEPRIKSKRPRKAAQIESDEHEHSGTPSDDDDDSAGETVPKKRAKKTSGKASHRIESHDDDDGDPVKDSNGHDANGEGPGARGKHSKPVQDESELSDVPDEARGAQKTNGTSAPTEGSESDMSVVFDEPPKKRGRKAAASEKRVKSKPTAKAKPKKAKSEGKELGPDEEEIKRLQGWLVKCGTRKLWHRELASCSTSKEKIKHLRGMLEEVGMTGRYSADKARQIKESRELAAELEAAQEFNQKWGQGDEESGGDDQDESDAAEERKEDAPPKRRMPKGFVDFGDSGDDGSD